VEVRSKIKTHLADNKTHTDRNYTFKTCKPTRIDWNHTSIIVLKVINSCRRHSSSSPQEGTIMLTLSRVGPRRLIWDSSILCPRLPITFIMLILVRPKVVGSLIYPPWCILRTIHWVLVLINLIMDKRSKLISYRKAYRLVIPNSKRLSKLRLIQMIIMDLLIIFWVSIWIACAKGNLFPFSALKNH